MKKNVIIIIILLVFSVKCFSLEMLYYKIEDNKKNNDKEADIYKNTVFSDFGFGIKNYGVGYDRLLILNNDIKFGINTQLMGNFVFQPYHQLLVASQVYLLMGYKYHGEISFGYAMPLTKTENVFYNEAHYLSVNVGFRYQNIINGGFFFKSAVSLSQAIHLHNKVGFPDSFIGINTAIGWTF